MRFFIPYSCAGSSLHVRDLRRVLPVHGPEERLGGTGVALLARLRTRVPLLADGVVARVLVGGGRRGGSGRGGSRRGGGGRGGEKKGQRDDAHRDLPRRSGGRG
jgi:hypothetical protein